MSEIRLNFLNWRPDMEPSSHDGLKEAQNVLHDTEGYKQLLRATVTSFATGLSGFPHTLISVQTRQIGSKWDASTDNKLHCLLAYNSGRTVTGLFVYPPNLSISLAASSTLTAVGGTAINIATAGAITAFEVCELNDYVFVTAEGKGNATAGTEVSANVTAYMDISLE